MIKLYYYLFHKKISRTLYQFLASPINPNIKKHNKQCFHFGDICVHLHSLGYMNVSDYNAILIYLCY